MAQQIRFFKRNEVDYLNVNAVITVTDNTATNDGSAFINYLRNRNNTSAWLTTGSNDAANTTLIFQFGGEKEIDSILMVLHNFKAFTIQYWDGSSYRDFSTPINETTNTDDNSFYSFTQVSTSQLKLIITGTITADADKSMRQFIATNSLVTGIGQLTGWPMIKKPEHSTEKKVSRMLSGKINVVETIGAFKCALAVDSWSIADDLRIVEEIYFGRRGVLVWPGGGDEEQFKAITVGYRKEDIYFMRSTNEYTPELAKSLYSAGYKLKLNLEEAIR
jgi:hypothetical protein